MSIEDRDIDGDGQYAAVVEVVPRGVRRQRDATNGGPMTSFFVVGVAGGFWQGQHRGHAVPKELEDGQRRLFALCLGRWELREAAIAAVGQYVVLRSL